MRRHCVAPHIWQNDHMAKRSAKGLVLAPCIYYGRVFDEPGEVKLGPRQAAIRSAYCLWSQLDGTSVFRQGRREWTLAQDGAALTEPGTTMRTTAGSRVAQVAFDLFPRRRRAHEGRFSILDAAPKQPAWRDAFGMELEPIIPAGLVAGARTLVGLVIDRYWIDNFGYWEAAARLHAWVVEFIKYLRAGPPQSRAGAQIAVRADRIMGRRFRHGCTVAQVAEALGLSRAALTSAYRRA
jgi:hypothetical protein